MADPQTTDMPAGARFGTLIGFTAWALALAAVVAGAGEPLLGLELGAIGVAAGLGLGQLSLRVTAAAQPAARLRVLWGSLLVSVGLLLLIWGLGFAPLLEDYPEVIESIGRVSATAVVPAWGCAVLIAIGAALLSLPDRD